MPEAIELTGGDYEHTLGLAGIRDGIDIRYTTAPLRDVFLRMLTERCYEACEFSLSNHLMLKDRGADWLHAIPVFPYRAFRHSTLYVRKDSPLREPADLRGKRVGVPDYSMTTAVWTRGILADQYGVHWQDLRWVVSGKQRFATLPGVTLEAAGKMDALLTPQTADDRKARKRTQIAQPDCRCASRGRDLSGYLRHLSDQSRCGNSQRCFATPARTSARAFRGL